MKVLLISFIFLFVSCHRDGQSEKPKKIENAGCVSGDILFPKDVDLLLRRGMTVSEVVSILGRDFIVDSSNDRDVIDFFFKRKKFADGQCVSVSVYFSGDLVDEWVATTYAGDAN